MATMRGYYRAELLRAITNIEMALTHMVRIVAAYADQHPEIANQAAEICEGLEIAGRAIQALHDSI